MFTLNIDEPLTLARATRRSIAVIPGCYILFYKRYNLHGNCNQRFIGYMPSSPYTQENSFLPEYISMLINNQLHIDGVCFLACSTRCEHGVLFAWVMRLPGVLITAAFGELLRSLLEKGGPDR